MSASKLSAAAVEFRPSFTPVAQSIAVVPSVQQPNQQNEAQFAQQPGAQQAQNQGPSQQQPEGADWCEDEYEDDGSWGYYEAGNWVAYEGQEDDWSASSAAGTEEQQHIQQQHGEQQPSMEADDAVALLHSCYPNHPRTLLQQLVEACDGDVQQAARILSDMDFEQRRSCISAAAAAGRATDTAASAARPSSTAGMSSRKQQQFNYSMEQFPALGGGGPGSSTAAGASASSRQNGLGSGSNWAAAANKPAAATSTKPRPSRQPAQPATTPTAAASKQWDSKGASEAVPWVKTGAAVSQEYAAARAEASDHARVRNACFQQATIAFMAGNKVGSGRVAYTNALRSACMAVAVKGWWVSTQSSVRVPAAACMTAANTCQGLYESLDRSRACS